MEGNLLLISAFCPATISSLVFLWGVASFLSGSMLLWGMVAAVPIVIHLLNRRRRRTVTWPAMQFLLVALQQRTRSVQIWQLLLLLARVLAVLLIAAALAHPVLQQPPPLVTVDPRLHLLVIDSSFSMRASGASGRSRFTAALEAADRYCRQANSGDRFLLVTMQRNPQVLIERPSIDIQAVREVIAQLEPSYTGASLNDTLSLLHGLLEQATLDEPEVVFFTDMQRRLWQPACEGTATAAWQRLIQRCRAVQVVDVATRDPLSQPNDRILSIQAVSQERVAIEMEFATVSPEGKKLEVRLDDSVIETPVVARGTSGRVVVDVSLPPRRDIATITATLPKDSLGVDNQRYLVVRPPISSQIVCLGAGTNTRFVVASLQVGADRPWEVRTMTTQQWLNLPEQQQQADLLVLCDVSDCPPALVQTFARLPAVLWWLGPAARPTGFADQAIPFRLEAIQDPGLYAIDPLGYQHPTVSSFQPFPESGLLSTPIFRYWRISPKSDWGEGTTALALQSDSGNHPLLRLWQRGSQRLAVVTTIPMAAATGDEPAWNAMVAWPSLVPLSQELATWLLASSHAESEYLVGDRIVGQMKDESGEPPEVRTPSGTLMDVTIQRNRQTPGQSQTPAGVDSADDVTMSGRIWAAGLAPEPGIYQVQFTDGRKGPVAVNVDASEGDLQTVDDDCLKVFNAVRDSPEASSRFTGVEATAPGRLPESDSMGALFRWLLAGAIAMLVAESLISRFALRWQVAAF